MPTNSPNTLCPKPLIPFDHTTPNPGLWSGGEVRFTLVVVVAVHLMGKVLRGVCKPGEVTPRVGQSLGCREFLVWGLHRVWACL